MLDRKKRFYSIDSFEKNLVPDYYYSRHDDDDDIERTTDKKTEKMLKIFCDDKINSNELVTSFAY